MTQSARSSGSARGLGRVVAFYVILVGLIATVFRFFPDVAGTYLGGAIQALGDADVFGQGAPPAVGAAPGHAPFGSAVVGMVSMLGALAIMIPVTWIYMMTRRMRGYDEVLVHTLLILPVAVTGIVIIVQNSLALAFSLAGIVAAVRFRTTLDDTKDAVYVFLAIGVGLASGVQALALALVLSVVFNGIVLVLWRSRFANAYADPRELSMGDVLAGPATAGAAVLVGDSAILDAVRPADLAEVAERAVRIERHISEERGKKKTKRANSLILVHAGSAADAQAYVEQLLEEFAERWKLIEIGPGAHEASLLQYMARLDGPGVQGAVMDRLRDSPGGVVKAAELRSLEGLSKRT